MFREQDRLHHAVASQLRCLYEHPAQSLVVVLEDERVSQPAARLMNVARELATPIGRPLQAILTTTRPRILPATMSCAS